MDDYRHRPRKNTPHVVKAYNIDTGNYLGRIVDITADGMMLVTKGHCLNGTIYQVRIMLPVMVHHKTDVDVEAQVVWSEPDTNPAYCKTGLKFLNLAGEDGFLLEDVMHKLNLVG